MSDATHDLHCDAAATPRVDHLSCITPARWTPDQFMLFNL